MVWAILPTGNGNLAVSACAYFDHLLDVPAMANEGKTYDTPTDFRAFLRGELVRRIKSNPHYSLRALSRTLDYDVSSLSKMLSGKRRIGPKLIKKFGKRIGLDRQMISYFIVQEIGGEYAQPENPRDFAALPVDVYSTISDWYHYAILELMYLPKFQSSPRWIAKALNLSVPEVELAVHRLKRVGLLEVTDGKWKEPKGDKLTTLGPEATSVAFRAMQTGLLQKAVAAIEEIPITMRDNSSMTMAIDSRKIAAAKERIKLFRREMGEFLATGGKPDNVYTLSIALFPLTRFEREP